MSQGFKLLILTRYNQLTLFCCLSHEPEEFCLLWFKLFIECLFCFHYVNLSLYDGLERTPLRFRNPTSTTMRIQLS